MHSLDSIQLQTKLKLKLKSKLNIENLKILLDHLIKWNKAYNLTGHKTPEAMVQHLILDSLNLLEFIENKSTYLDLGCGPGFPSLPLAILKPDSKFILVDSNLKKLKFAKHIVRTLNLNNITIYNNRIEDLDIKFKIDAVLTKAFAPLDLILKLTEHLPIQKHLALKGPKGIEEAEKSGLNYKIYSGKMTDSKIIEVYLK